MRHAIFFFIFCSILPIAVAQTDDSLYESDESSLERTAQDIENFVDELVNRIEINVDRMVENRNDNRNRYDLDHDWDMSETQESYTEEIHDAVSFNGDTEILKTDTIHGDIVVKNGTLTIYGVVTGDVLVVNGDIALKSTSHVLGNIRALNGTINKDSGSIVEGFMEQTSNSNSRKGKRKSTMRTKYSYSFKPYFLNSENVIDDNFLFRYNRVEGFFFGFGSEKNYYWDGSKVLSGYGSFGYGFASHRWRVQLGVDRQFASGNGVMYELGGEIHSMTDTKDEWIMHLSENNLSAIFFREDFRDYFQREGYSIHTARYMKDDNISTMFDLRFHNDRHTSMANQAHWAVFGGTIFRNNPLIDEGTMKSVSFSTGLTTVEKYRRQQSGWNLFARGEYGGREFGGSFDFTHLVVDLRRFQLLSSDNQINIRIRAGALEGRPIVQRMFELGGANTLPAYGFKEFSGNRMLLTNLEYRLSGEAIDELFFWPSSVSLIAFGDAGVATTVSSKLEIYNGFNSITSDQIKSDYGVALAWHDGDAKLGFAWRTDKQAPVSIFFRLKRTF